MILLTKDNTATPDSYSAGDGSDPVAVAFSLDGSGIPATMTKSPSTDLFVWADNHSGGIDNYATPVVGITGADAQVLWELSLNGVDNWAASISLAPLDVSVNYQAVQIFARATVANDGSIDTNNYVAAKVTITATENPA
jgi:hypothetical protein